MGPIPTLCGSLHQPVQLSDRRSRGIGTLPSVSVVIPCRNEEQFIVTCLDSVIANDYPKDRLELLVVDGMSSDRTRVIIQRHAARYPYIKLLDNPSRITPAGLNIGVRQAGGEIIMRMDAHATYDPEYISRCVKALDDHNADNVGGILKIVPRTHSTMARPIAKSLAHRFGIGNAHFRLPSSVEPRWVDTVPFFCLRKEVLEKVGLFDERLARGQDMEFSLRLRKAGGRTLLVPDIISYYYARSDMKSFCRHNWRNGVWAILPFLYSPTMPVSWRHLVPLAFVMGLLGSAVLALLLPVFLWVTLGIGGVYVLANLAASAQVAFRENDIKYFFAMPVVFAALHFAYGLGSLWGMARLAAHVVWVSRRKVAQEESGSPGAALM